jgi:hypothetical protein
VESRLLLAILIRFSAEELLQQLPTSGPEAASPWLSSLSEAAYAMQLFLSYS